MSSWPTLPQRTWLERFALLIAGALMAVGIVTAGAWYWHIEEVLQPFVGQAPLKMNAAIALFVLGGVLLAIELGYRRLAVLAILPALIGGLTLAEDIFGINLRIDELLLRDYLPVKTEHAGRMAAMVSVCLLLSGLTLAWRATKRRARARLFAEAATGSILAATGFSTLLGYRVSLAAVYSWGTRSATSPVAAVTLLVLGFAILSLAWRESIETDGEAPAWSPMPFVIGCLTLTVILWIGLGQQENSYLGANTITAMDRLATGVRAEFDRQQNQLERLARRWSDMPSTSLITWDTVAAPQWADASEAGCRLIANLDESGKAITVFPVENNEGSIGFNHTSLEERRVALQRARLTGNPIISSTTRVHTAKTVERGIAIYAPMMRGGKPDGYVTAEFAYYQLFRNIAVRENLLDHYRISVSIGRDSVYSSTIPAEHWNENLTIDRTYTIIDRHVSVSFTPSVTAVAKDRRYLPELALAAGIGITILLGLSVHLARRARTGQLAAELSNKKLFGENEERRRIEARLKVSDERLRLALDSTQIGIFERSVAAGHVYYSPGLWAMLGYDHARMPSTVESWQALIHPDDLPLYRRGIESQLNGAISFIDPEYRVRAKSGDWRWVYTRSKSVAASADGRPTRIIGTVQDITARREAEAALRESQAEARKLSLVAAKTDNPVLIGSPDGRIEWANEAFCRVMEYSLDEVIGKNPAHFMLGPETNPRTIARIRAAMTQGQGISTDVVNYSKSGRKYHLHVEIQPVRSATGDVTNFIAVETDITSRVETEHQLRRAKAEADDASRAKSEFLASMSHEIRTPMNGVIGMTSLLMETLLSAEQRDYVNTIRTSGEALLTIINDILDFSKIESGKMELERSPFELAVCIEETLDLFALQASAKKLELGYYLDPNVPAWVLGDVTRLRQVLVNLVNNAVKFTPSGSISLEVRRAVHSTPPLGFEAEAAPNPEQVLLEFTINDSGIGIPPDRLDRLFKAFSQVDSSTTRKYGGTGLGLAICQRLAQLMGGDIRVESVVGKGSSFSFTLQTEAAPGPNDSGLPTLPPALRTAPVLCIEDNPVTQARLRGLFEKWGAQCVIAPDAPRALEVAAKLAVPPALLVVDGGDTDNAVPLDALARFSCPRLVLFPFGQTAPVGPLGGPPCASTSKPVRTAPLIQAVTTLFHAAAAGSTALRVVDKPIGHEIPLEILLAEDNPVNQKVALRFLERLGYRAEAVANGLEAVTAVENRRYDLVFMDLQMPEMDGFEATRQIRTRLTPERQPKIVALTANAMQGDREACVAAGMDDYISKPVKMHEIAAAIRRHFAKASEVSTPP
jgi:PAS domain S-box-containing protein